MGRNKGAIIMDVRNIDIVNEIERVKDFFNGTYIYDAGKSPDELIIGGKIGGKDYTISFILDMNDKVKFLYKLLSYLSYLTADNHYGRKSQISLYYHERINRYFKTSFTLDELQKIYCRIGTGCNPELGYKFIESGFDMGLL